MARPDPPPQPRRIGTLRETPLHADLKAWCSRPGDRVEVPVDGYVVDLVRDDLLIEIQTSGFSSMKAKLRALLGAGHRLRIVHPIPVTKWIVKVEADGEIVSRRRSPRRGAATDVFAEVVSFPEALVHPGFELDVVLTEEEEYRARTDHRAWRRGGWSILERRLIEVLEVVTLRGAGDVVDLIPDGLPDPFTTADLAAALGRPRRVSQQMAYCLREAGIIAAVGKTGNAVRYHVGRVT